MADEDNIFADCEDRLFSKAESEYEQQRREVLERSACRVERKRLMVSSDRYLDTLELMQKKAAETEVRIENVFDDVSEKLCETAAGIEDDATKSLRSIKRLSAQAVRVVKLASRQQRFRLAGLLVSSFLCGIMVTVFVYHAFIVGIMNKYLHHTIEIMAAQEITQARTKAEEILRNANIKADGILKEANSYAKNENASLKKGGQK